MKIGRIAIDQITRAKISLNGGWDYIYFTYDTSYERGHITITSSYGEWSYIWGAMGKTTTLPEFFIRADNDYLARKLYGPDDMAFDASDALVDMKKDLFRDRKSDSTTKEDAREIYDEIVEVFDHSDFSRDDMQNMYYKSKLPDLWNQDFWEVNYGMRPKGDFLCLKHKIIPLIRDYFKGTLDQYIETKPQNLAKGCDCHEYKERVCDICQGVSGQEKDRL